MSHPFEKPAVHYGLGLSSAAILVFIAFAFLEDTMRLAVLGIAVLEVTVVPQILKKAGEQHEG